MVRAGLVFGCFALLALTATAAAEQRTPGSGVIILRPLGPPRLVEAPTPPAPYPRTYAEQVAQSLGVRDGGLSLTQPSGSANPYAPSVSFTGSMLRLRWRP